MKDGIKIIKVIYVVYNGYYILKNNNKSVFAVKLSLPLKVAGFLILFGILGVVGWMINGKTFLDNKKNIKNASHKKIPDIIYVHISGAVKNSGLYKVRVGYRIGQLIELTGGLSAGADISGINLAGVLMDGQKVIIPASKKTSNKFGIGKGPKESYINPPFEIKKVD